MMYAKLIFKNAKRSGKDYLIYIVDVYKRQIYIYKLFFFALIVKNS